jgi:hypothetical protein
MYQTFQYSFIDVLIIITNYCNLNSINLICKIKFFHLYLIFYWCLLYFCNHLLVKKYFITLLNALKYLKIPGFLKFQDDFMGYLD